MVVSCSIPANAPDQYQCFRLFVEPELEQSAPARARVHVRDSIFDGFRQRYYRIHVKVGLPVGSCAETDDFVLRWQKNVDTGIPASHPDITVLCYSGRHQVIIACIPWAVSFGKLLCFSDWPSAGWCIFFPEPKNASTLCHTPDITLTVGYHRRNKVVHGRIIP